MCRSEPAVQLIASGVATYVHNDVRTTKMSQEAVAAKYKLSQTQVTKLIFKVINNSNIIRVM